MSKVRPNNACDPLAQDGPEDGSDALIRPQNIAKAASAEQMTAGKVGPLKGRTGQTVADGPGFSKRLGFHGVSVVFRTFVGAKALYFASGGVDEFVLHMKNFGSHFIFRRLG